MIDDLDSKEAYMYAMVKARRERDYYASKLGDEAINAHEWLDTVARALGIQTGRESWWDGSEEECREKVLNKIAKLKKGLDTASQGE